MNALFAQTKRKPENSPQDFMRHLRLSRCSYYTKSIAKLDVPCHYSRLKFVFLCLHVNFRCTTLPFDNVTIFIFRVFHSFIVLKTTDGMKVPSSTSKIQEEVYIASVPKKRLLLWQRRYCRLHAYYTATNYGLTKDVRAKWIPYPRSENKIDF